MATSLQDVDVSSRRTPPAQGQGQDLPPESLPLGLCGGCEWSCFGAFEAAGPEDETLWKSPDRRAAEASEEPAARRFRCRRCGRVVQRIESGKAGQVSVI